LLYISILLFSYLLFLLFLFFFSFLKLLNLLIENLQIKNILTSALVISSFATGFASSNSPDSMRAATAVQINTKYASCVSLSRDADGNIVSFHVNGVAPTDAGILLTKASAPLSTEYTIVSGVTKEGGISSFMLPSNVATARVIEAMSQDLVNAGAVSIQINRVLTGKM